VRTFWLTARIAAIFALLLTFSLLATLHLFGKVLGRDVVGELVALRTDQGELLGRQMEQLLEDHELSDPEVEQFVHKRAGELDIQIAVMDGTGEPVYGSCGGLHCRRARRWARELRSDLDLPCADCDAESADAETMGGDGESARKRGRSRHREARTKMRERRGRPAFEITVPVTRGDQTVATLAMTRPQDDPEPSRRAFRWGLLQIGGVGLLGVIAISLVLTRPLRRMSRSMDRIASGDLDHRVPARGRDEVASMGRSFNSMAERIQTMIRGQKELMAGVSHELRSPLGRMKLNLELLREAGANEGRLGEMEGEVDTLDGMVAELLVASRLDLGSERVSPEPCSLPDAAAEAWHRVDREATERGIELQLDGDTVAPVHADRALLVRVLGNLFENAVRYGGAGPVTLSADVEGEGTRIRVRDRGEGVPPEHLSQLFDPFYRADPSRSRKTGGTGLGLMIVRRAVEAHGGQVTARQADGSGLEIEFDLPTPQPDA